MHVKAKATFEIFWCDFSVGFDQTLIAGERPPRLEAVDVTAQLLTALEDPQNWSGQPEESEHRLVVLRDAQAVPGLDAGKVVSYAASFQALGKLKQENPAKAKTLMLVRVSAPITHNAK